jgi:hypothetical protein
MSEDFVKKTKETLHREGEVKEHKSIVITLSTMCVLIIICSVLYRRTPKPKGKMLMTIIYVVAFSTIVLSGMLAQYKGMTGAYNWLSFPVYNPGKPLPDMMDALRGDNYYAVQVKGVPQKEDKVWITSWHLYHFWFNFFLGFFCHRHMPVILGVGVMWEVFEATFFDCADGFDVLWNGLGAFSGFFAHMGGLKLKQFKK